MQNSVVSWSLALVFLLIWSWSSLHSHTSSRSMLCTTSPYPSTSGTEGLIGSHRWVNLLVLNSFFLLRSSLLPSSMVPTMRGSLGPSHFYTPQHPLCINGLTSFGKTVRCEMGKLKCMNMLTAAVNLFCLEAILSHWKLVPVLTACWSSMTSLLASLGFHQNHLHSSHWHSDYSLRFSNWFHLLKYISVKKWRLGLNCLQPVIISAFIGLTETSQRLWLPQRLLIFSAMYRACRIFLLPLILKLRIYIHIHSGFLRTLSLWLTAQLSLSSTSSVMAPGWVLF